MRQITFLDKRAANFISAVDIVEIFFIAYMGGRVHGQGSPTLRHEF